MGKADKSEYLVTRRDTQYRFCKYCNGSGKKEYQQGRNKYVSNCSMCSGTGKSKITVTSEVLLSHALTDLGFELPETKDHEKSF